MVEQNPTILVEKTAITYIVIAICTCLRPKMLKNSLLSINETIFPENIKTEILVVDNDKEQSAKNIVEDVKQISKCKIHYFVEENRGIAYARNKVLDEAINLGASHILFFDDDELLTKDVLIRHIDMYNKTQDANIISGPTISKFETNYPSYIKKHMVFKQSTTKKTGLKRDRCASGNVFFPTNMVKDYNLKFDTKYIFMGGEDGDFFNRASKLGFNIVWCNEAIIEEVVPPARANIPYILKKCYYNGFAGTQEKFKENRNSVKKYIYLTKTTFVLLLNILTLIPSLLLGLTGFFNTLGTTARTYGKLCATVQTKPCNFYRNIYGE